MDKYSLCRKTNRNFTELIGLDTIIELEVETITLQLFDYNTYTHYKISRRKDSDNMHELMNSSRNLL